jgi:hypothetical protein
MFQGCVDLGMKVFDDGVEQYSGIFIGLGPSSRLLSHHLLPVTII